ncbi:MULTISPECIES: hypothetical protein [unclassified Rhizobium]|uniref:hypothetical protein n=1 Tax=unclassified Rhizobium TaxID=2613769 RepID=UPI0012E37E70|nr:MULTISPECIES: hypothetical protein [unclassified Rhizobium]
MSGLIASLHIATPTSVICPSIDCFQSHLPRSIAPICMTFPACIEGNHEIFLSVNSALKQFEQVLRGLSGDTYVNLGLRTEKASTLKHAIKHLDMGCFEIVVGSVGRHCCPPFVGAKVFNLYAMAPASNAIDKKTMRHTSQLSKVIKIAQAAWRGLPPVQRAAAPKPLLRAPMHEPASREGVRGEVSVII